MNNQFKTLCVVISAVASISCVIWAYGKFRHIRETDTNRIELSAANVALKEKLNEQETRTALMTRGVQSIRTEIKKERDHIEKVFATNREKQKAWEKLLNDNPALQNKQVAAYRSNVSAKYGPFLHKMRLSPEQRGRIEGALVQRRMDNDDLNAVLAGTGVTPEKADAAWLHAKKETEDAFALVVAEVLGEEGRQQFARYESNWVLWDYASELAAGAARCGIPLSLEQADKLVDILASIPKRQMLSRTGDLGMPTEETDWAYVDEQAKIFLSKEQFDLYRSTEFGNNNLRRFQLLYDYARMAAMSDVREKERKKDAAQNADLGARN